MSLAGLNWAIAEPTSSVVSGKTFRDCDGCPDLVVVPAGAFKMGTPSDAPIILSNEVPQHAVRIPHDFAVGKFEITRNQFHRFVEETGHRFEGGCFSIDSPFEALNDRSYLNPGFTQKGSEPVTCVNWVDATAYARWLSDKTGKKYRLLSEAEWEYAAQNGADQLRSKEGAQCEFDNLGDLAAKKALNLDAAPADCSDGHVYTSPVGSFAPNGFGLYDMLGNAREWVEDCWHENYEGAPSEPSAWTSGDCTQRVMRGSTFDTYGEMRPALRGPMQAEMRAYNNGFRLARDIDPVP
jgi:formylglycine-generating enzyme required for sulfatase activity